MKALSNIQSYSNYSTIFSEIQEGRNKFTVLNLNIKENKILGFRLLNVDRAPNTLFKLSINKPF